MRNLYMFGEGEPESIAFVEEKIAETMKDQRTIDLLQYIKTSTITVGAIIELAKADLVGITYEGDDPVDLDEISQQVEHNKVELEKLSAEFGLELSDEI